MGYAGYRLFKQLEGGDTVRTTLLSSTSDAGSTTPATSTRSTSTARTDESFPLMKGKSRGMNVGLLQKALGVNVDGIFGSQTEQALVAAYGVKSVDEATFTRILNQKGVALSNARLSAGSTTLLPAATLPASVLPTSMLPGLSTGFRPVNNAYFIANRYAVAVGATALYEQPSRNARLLQSFAPGSYVGYHSGKSADINHDPRQRWALVNTGTQSGWVFSGDIQSHPSKPEGLNGTSTKIMTIIDTAVRGENNQILSVNKHTILGEVIGQTGVFLRFRNIQGLTGYVPAAAVTFLS
jgi:hypothetical protein